MHACSLKIIQAWYILPKCFRKKIGMIWNQTQRKTHMEKDMPYMSLPYSVPICLKELQVTGCSLSGKEY